MRKFIFFIFTMFILACSTNPITGKSPLILVSNANLFPMAFQQYRKMLQKESLSKDKVMTNRINTVGVNIVKAVHKDLKERNQMSFLNGYQWEFSLIENDQLNAWCMPGGKVAFYTGIMPICKNDDGVAVVMGHEITHALAEHSAQRMSQAMVAQGLQVAGNIALSDSKYKNVFNQLYPVGAKVGILAYSRSAEMEADAIGLRLMAKAGYDPREAPKFWERMQNAAKSKGKNAPPEFLSTHPNPGRRIAQLKKLLPEVMPYYYKAKGIKQ